MKRWEVCAVLCLVFSLSAVSAHATLLSPTASLSPGGTVVSPPKETVGGGSGSVVDNLVFNSSPYYPAGCATDPNGNPAITGAVGTLVADTCLLTRHAIGGVGGLTGLFREAVFQESGGTLDFYYQMSVLSRPAGSTSTLIDMFQFPFGFGGTNVATASDVSMLGPTYGTGTGAHDSPTAVTAGGTGSSPQKFCKAAGNTCVTWIFGTNVTGGLGVGSATMTEVIATDATSFGLGQIGFDVTGGAGMDAVKAFAPTPEPISILLLGTILAAGALFLRRKKAVKADLSVS